MGWTTAIHFSTESHIFQLDTTLRQAQLTSSHTPGDFQIHGSVHLKQWEFLSNLMTQFYFDTFTHSLHVSGIYHPSSGAMNRTNLL
jgi:hypothetical protein